MRILLVAPTLNPPGGGELVAAWFVEALRGEHELTLLACEAPRLSECNLHFGTSLEPSDFDLALVPQWLARPLRLLPWRLDRLRDALLTRACLAIASRFDLVVTTNNEMDLGGHGLQYVHYPRENLYKPGVPSDVPRGLGGLAIPYGRFCDGLARSSVSRMRTNTNLVNSDWTGRWVRRVHPVETRTLYPPVPGTFPQVPWEDRDDAVVALGRLDPSKRFEDIVEAVARVRRAGPPLRLTIAAFDGGNRAYAERLRALLRRHGDWASMREGLSRAGLDDLLVRHRYGMHAMVDEHFGIAVAEMVRAGCIALVPDSGGPPEIVGAEPLLRYSDIDEAATNLTAIVSSPDTQTRLREHLAARAACFSCERFVTELRERVREAAARRATLKGAEDGRPAMVVDRADAARRGRR